MDRIINKRKIVCIGVSIIFILLVIIVLFEKKNNDIGKPNEFEIDNIIQAQIDNTSVDNIDNGVELINKSEEYIYVHIIGEIKNAGVVKLKERKSNNRCNRCIRWTY